MSLWRKKRFWFGLAITAVFLYLVFRQIRFEELTQALARADYIWLLPALLVYLGGYLLRAVRWQRLLSSVKPVRWVRLLPPLILSFTANNLLPARAGEFVGAYLVGQREGVSKTSAFATVLMQRAFDGLIMVLLAVIVLAAFHVPIEVAGVNAGFVATVNTVIKVTAALFVLLFLFLLAVMIWKEHASAVLGFVTRRLPGAWGGRAERIGRSFLEGLTVLRSRRATFEVLVLTLAAWVGESAAYYFILRAFGLALPVYAAVMLMAVVNLGIMVPSSPGYIGPFEFFGVGTLLLFGINKAASLPCILVIHAMVWLPITLWGFYYLWTLKLSLSAIKQQADPGPEQ